MDAVLPAEDRLAATRVIRDLGALPPDAITAALFRAQGESGLARLYLTDRRAFDRRMERGRQHFFGPPSGAHAAYLRSKGIID